MVQECIEECFNTVTEALQYSVSKQIISVTYFKLSSQHI